MTRFAVEQCVCVQVYQRADLNRVLMSQSVGAFCNVRQDVTSSNYSEGAEVALDMIEYEREREWTRLVNPLERGDCFVRATVPREDSFPQEISDWSWAKNLSRVSSC